MPNPDVNTVSNSQVVAGWVAWRALYNFMTVITVTSSQVVVGWVARQTLYTII